MEEEKGKEKEREMTEEKEVVNISDIAVNLATQYQSGVIKRLNESEDSLPILSFANGTTGITCISFKDSQYLILSSLKADRDKKKYPSGEDVVDNIIGIKLDSLEDITNLETWLTVAKANIISKSSLVGLLPKEQREELANK